MEEKELKPKQPDLSHEMMAGYIPLFKQMRSVKRPLSAAPTFTPQNFLEQIQFYKNGSTYRVYFYIEGSWKYSTLS